MKTQESMSFDEFKAFLVRKGETRKGETMTEPIFRDDWARRAMKGSEVPPRGTKCAHCAKLATGRARWQIVGYRSWLCPPCNRQSLTAIRQSRR